MSESKTDRRIAAGAATIRTVRSSFRRLAQSAERLHAGVGVTAAMRVVLEMLAEAGPMTVPQMARRKGTSRQHFQTKVDVLAAAGLVETRPNPAHARSVLVALTGEGAAVFSGMQAREARLLAAATEGLDAHEIEAAGALLERMVAAIETAAGDGEAEEEDGDGED